MAERNRNGVRLAVLVRNDQKEDRWDETLLNIPSGVARTPAALLVAAADISDGITRFPQ